ncbi:F-box/kelch-repeat protein At3g06240-like [Cornus florida]|uniref:F-box/kelch-repeat protein At3g06240-like n=1 Tax=Cornus florida TaxID=4283 RepID=UPI0028A29E38|nr:F-box/kelch-repeat protein At3g06240-like [Cornus florida]
MKLDFPWIKDPYLFDDFVASCNGLLLVRVDKRHDYPMHSLNPSTRESKKLPDYDFGVDPYFRLCMHGLGYDSSMDDYKVVAVSYYAQHLLREDRESDCKDTFVVVYSLKNSSWGRKWIQDFPYDNSFIVPGSGVFVNGSVHWLTYRSLVHLPVIVAFDVADEKFRDVLLPTSHEPGSLGLLGGCLFCCNENDDLWVMKECGDSESWTKFTIDIPKNMYSLESLCVLLDNELLLKWYKDEKMDEDIFVIYNDKEQRLRYIMVDGIPLKSTDSFRYQQSAVTYVESIVSPYFHCGIDRKK